MKLFIIYLLKALKYFIIQTLSEVILICILIYLGLPYSGIILGNEHLYEIIIGVLGYHALFKSLIYSWFYFILFVLISFLIKCKKEMEFGIINAFLSLLLPFVILLIRHLLFSEMANAFISTIAASVLIILIISLTYRQRI